MSAVAEHARAALSVAALWDAIKIARRKHRDQGLDIVLMTMAPADLRELRWQDGRHAVISFDHVRSMWTAFGIPITERRFPGSDSDRVLVLQRRNVPPSPQVHWKCTPSRGEYQTVTEDY